MQRSLVSHTSVRSFYAVTITLLLSYRIAVLRPCLPSDGREVILQALEVLEPWKTVPFMRQPLQDLDDLWLTTFAQ